MPKIIETHNNDLDEPPYGWDVRCNRCGTLWKLTQRGDFHYGILYHSSGYPIHATCPNCQHSPTVGRYNTATGQLEQF